MDVRHVLRVASLLGVGIAMSTALATDWPQFRGINDDGFSPEKGINKNWTKKQPKLLWKLDIGEKGFGGPAVANGKVYVIGHLNGKDIVQALDFKTGKPVWSYSYAEEEDDQWGFTRSTPTIVKDKVYTLGRMGTLNCLNEKDGKLIWTVNLVKEFKGILPRFFYGASPLVDGNKVVVVVGAPDAPVMAFDRLTGKVLWSCKVEKDIASYATPIITTIEGKRQYVVYLGASAVGIDPETGSVIWRHDWQAANISQPVILGNSVFLSSAYGLGSKLVDIKDGKTTEKWKNKAPQAHFNAPLFFNGYIYLSSDPDDLMCVDPKDGKVMWKQKGFGNGGLLGADGVGIIIDGKNGDMVMFEFNPFKYKEIGRFKPLGGQSWTAPILANGKYIVRNLTTIACYNAK
jgi:outer membrane protein assembly factor BamB